MESVTVGLDIGSSAVRAAEIQVAKDGRRQLRRYAQVGLPHGYVVDGEINNLLGVAEALRRLWIEGGFSTQDVVLGVSGPRVFVRQADMPALSPEDLRSSLRFDAQELVPIAMEDACFDFSILEQDLSAADPTAQPTQRILLVAAHQDLLRNYITTLKSAGLNPIALDAAPLALIRAVPLVSLDGAAPGVEVIVSIGAELTTVAVREDGVPRFIRSLTVGGASLTETIANKMHIELAVAERLKRGAVAPDVPQLGAARKAMSAEMRDLAEDVRATIDFFLSQSGQTHIDRLLVTGGGSQTEGLAAAITAGLDAPVMALDPTSGFDVSSLPYGPEDLRRIAASSTTAIGLALWTTEAPLIRLSILPEEVLEARRARRRMLLAAGGLFALLGALGVASITQVMHTRAEQQKASQAEVQVSTLTARVATMQAATKVHLDEQARARLVAQAVSGDVDWARVLAQVGQVMPPNVYLQSFQGTRNLTTGVSKGATVLGTVNFNARADQGGLPSVDQWVQQLSQMGGGHGALGDLAHVWVSALQVKGNDGTVTYNSTADLTTAALSNRDKDVTK